MNPEWDSVSNASLGVGPADHRHWSSRTIHPECPVSSNHPKREPTKSFKYFCMRFRGTPNLIKWETMTTSTMLRNE